MDGLDPDEPVAAFERIPSAPFGGRAGDEATGPAPLPPLEPPEPPEPFEWAPSLSFEERAPWSGAGPAPRAAAAPPALRPPSAAIPPLTGLDPLPPPEEPGPRVDPDVLRRVTGLGVADLERALPRSAPPRVAPVSPGARRVRVTPAAAARRPSRTSTTARQLAAARSRATAPPPPAPRAAAPPARPGRVIPIGVPGATGLDASPAAWRQRALALAVDIAVLAALAVGAFLVTVLALGAVLGLSGATGDDAVDAAAAAGLLAAAAAALLYMPVALALTGGRTVGKRTAGVRVVAGDGGRVGLGRALWREVGLRWLLFGVLLGWLAIPALLDYLNPLRDPQGRALHDVLAGTRVVRG